MALAVSVEPFRIGMIVLMLNRPKPALQLFAFLCGGFAMGTTVGLVVLFVLRRILLGTSFVTVPRVQILIGLLVLFFAAVVAVDLPGRLGPRPAKLATPARELLKGDSLSVAGIAGISIALPSVAMTEPATVAVESFMVNPFLVMAWLSCLSVAVLPGFIFTTASPFSRLTSTVSTPDTDFNDTRTAWAQTSQSMPRF